VQHGVLTLPRATPSTGTPTPMVRHIVDRGDWPRGVSGSESAEPQQRALCGEPWDRIGVSAGPLCDGCEAEYRRRHPTWPLPGETA